MEMKRSVKFEVSTYLNVLLMAVDRKRNRAYCSTQLFVCFNVEWN